MKKVIKKKNVLIVTGTRAEFGLFKPVIDEIQKDPEYELHLIVTGTHLLRRYGNTINEIYQNGVSVQATIKIGERDSMLESLSKIIKGVERYCSSNVIDFILVLGDRGEQLAAALVGVHSKIPVGHIHGGDITGHVVDEYLRHAITKLASLHFAASKQSFDNILRLGEESWRVHNVGAPGLDMIRQEKVLNKTEMAKRLSLDAQKKWLLVVQHPVPLDEVDLNDQILTTLEALELFDAEKVIIYPNSDTGSDVFIDHIEKLERHAGYHLHRNLDRRLYLSLMANSDVMIGNSSSAIIESGYFNLPVVDIGTRQGNRECGTNVCRVNFDKRAIFVAIKKILKFDQRSKVGLKNPYGDGRAGERIFQIIKKHIGKRYLNFKTLRF